MLECYDLGVPARRVERWAFSCRLSFEILLKFGPCEFELGARAKIR